MLTLTDLFAGLGGSTTGAVSVPGVVAVVAANHWALAIESHAANHPDTEHVCADISQYDPRLFPRTDLLWASPSCTHHSSAQGKKRTDLQQPDLFGEILPDEAAERSRATMWDVVRFSEHHKYQAVIVENVVEVLCWPPFRAWLSAMDSLGYNHCIVFLNSMHSQVFGPGAPQSRDRVYIGFWRKGNPAPDFERVVRPRAVCPDHGVVEARQVFNPGRKTPWARYRSQYVYVCSVTGCCQVVEPAYRPAAEAIDWTLKGQRIGDRKRPLADKTLARIRAGVEKYWLPQLVPVEGRSGGRARPVSDPARTMTCRNETGLLVPAGGTWRNSATTTGAPFPARTTRENDGLAFIAQLRGGGCKPPFGHQPITDALTTVTAGGRHHALVTTYYGNGSTSTADDALSTVTTRDRHALLMRNNTSKGSGSEMVTPTEEYARTITTAGHQTLLTGFTIDLDDVLFRMLEPHEISAAMDFPRGYKIKGNKRERVRQAGGAVTPPCSRDLVGVTAESLGVAS